MVGIDEGTTELVEDTVAVCVDDWVRRKAIVGRT